MSIDDRLKAIRQKFYTGEGLTNWYYENQVKQIQHATIEEICEDIEKKFNKGGAVSQDILNILYFVRDLQKELSEIKCIYTECPHPEDCKTECLLDGAQR